MHNWQNSLNKSSGICQNNMERTSVWSCYTSRWRHWNQVGQSLKRVCGLVLWWKLMWPCLEQQTHVYLLWILQELVKLIKSQHADCSISREPTTSTCICLNRLTLLFKTPPWVSGVRPVYTKYGKGRPQFQFWFLILNMEHGNPLCRGDWRSFKVDYKRQSWPIWGWTYCT